MAKHRRAPFGAHDARGGSAHREHARLRRPIRPTGVRRTGVRRGVVPVALVAALGALVSAGALLGGGIAADAGTHLGPNLLRNARFAHGLTGWSTGGRDESLQLTSGLHGSQAVELTRDAAGPVALVAKPVGLSRTKPRASYVASAWVEAVPGSGVAATLRVRVDRSDQPRLQLADTAPLTRTGWTELSVRFGAPVGGERVRVAVLGAGVDSAAPLLVSDVSLREIVTTAPSPSASPSTSPTSSPSPLPSGSPTPSSSPPPSATPTPTPIPSRTSPPAPGSGGTLFGASIWENHGESFGAALAREDDQFGRMPIVRVYYPGPPRPWPGDAGLPDRPVVVSFNIPPQKVLSGADDSLLAKWFDTAPRGLPVYWCYIHEPEKPIREGQFTPAEYKAAWVHVAAIAAAAHNPDLHATLILMGYTLQPVAHRDWLNYYPGGNVVDVIAWDVYNSNYRHGGYENPADLFEPEIQASKSVGKPWAVAEVGSLLTPGDAGQGRARWMESMASWLRQQGALWVTYFDSDKGGNYELTDPFSIAAWRSVVTGNLFGEAGKH